MNAIVPRATIEQIAAARDQALVLYSTAYDRIAEAAAAIGEADDMARNVRPGSAEGLNNYNYEHVEEISAFHSAVTLPDRDRYLRTARKLLDVNAWAYTIERTDLERLMDKEAKDKLRQQMAYVPDRVSRDGELINGDEIAKGLPPFTVENVQATIEAFVADSGNIFRRGISNVFSKLDRRFRSHDGFKVGSRIILTYAFDVGPFGGGLKYGSIRDQLVDIERVFAVLDGKPEASFRSALGELENDRRHTRGPRQSEVETEYFRIKGFMNGNAHLWFQRRDLVEKVNKLLAEWYGEVIGDGREQEADPFADIKTTPAKRYGFFPTPERAVSELFHHLPLMQKIDEPQLTILEPSAGTGNLARHCLRDAEAVTANYSRRAEHLEEYLRHYRWDNAVDCVEIQPHLAGALEIEGIYRRVYNMDFLRLDPATTGHYDRVVMNPPFDRERDIDHVMHALKFLKPDGILVAIMSAGTEFRETRKAIAFRKLVEERGGDFRDLPAGSFSEVGTNVNTVILTIGKTRRW